MKLDPFSLEGKRILVTGASSGIGRQVAISCAEMGASVVTTGRNAARLAETLATMPGTGHLAVEADLVKEQDRARLAAAAGALEGVAHCAGIAAIVPFRMVSRKHLDEIFDVNFCAPMLLTQYLLAKRQIKTGGALIFITSSAAHIGTPATSMYAASKGGLFPAARALALEVGAKQRIRVNCISPGYTRTPMLDALNSQGTSIEANYDLAPLGMGEPEDIANAAVFLLSDASRWVTRSTLQVDGGLTARISF